MIFGSINRKILKKVLFCCLIAFAGCSNIQLPSDRQLTNITMLTTFAVNEDLTKCLYSQRTATFYGMDKTQNKVHFYRDGRRFNSIGGLGVDNMSFQRLSDITMDNEGNLLCLDSFAKQIKKYNVEGKWLSTFDLSSCLRPELLSSNQDNNIFVYDKYASEIICFSGLDGKELYRFGKFQILNVASISASRQRVIIYNADSNSSLIFSVFGQLTRTLDNCMISDDYGNLMTFGNNLIKSDYASAYALGSSIYYFDKYLSVCGAGSVFLYALEY